jgi:hypothetical protein
MAASEQNTPLEVVSLRTMCSKTVQNEDGSFTLQGGLKMADELLDGVIDEIILSDEDNAEQEILAQTDALETLVRSANDPFGNLIAISLESKNAGKKVVTYFDYAEEMDGKVVRGRSVQGKRKSIVSLDAKVTQTEVSVIKQRSIERG